MRFFQHVLFVVRYRYIKVYAGWFRRWSLRFQGMQVDEGTRIPVLKVTWPHQVKIGKTCILEHDIYFHFDGQWKGGPSIVIGNNVFVGFACEFNITKRITIGNDCLIASGCKFIDHDHGMHLGELMRKQKSIDAEISIGSNVWLGANVVVLKGVSIADGAVVAAGAVVTKSIPSNEIWGGVPAKKIGERQ